MGAAEQRVYELMVSFGAGTGWPLSEASWPVCQQDLCGVISSGREISGRICFGTVEGMVPRLHCRPHRLSIGLRLQGR